MNRARLRYLRYLLAALALVCVSCFGVVSNAFEHARAVAAPEAAPTWWAALEECAGRQGTLSSVNWFVIPGYFVIVEGRAYDGYWLKERNAVIFAEAQFEAADRRPHVLRHELLHALLGRGDHPAEYFARRCVDLVAAPER